MSNPFGPGQSPAQRNLQRMQQQQRQQTQRQRQGGWWALQQKKRVEPTGQPSNARVRLPEIDYAEAARNAARQAETGRAEPRRLGIISRMIRALLMLALTLASLYALVLSFATLVVDQDLIGAAIALVVGLIGFRLLVGVRRWGRA